MSVALTEGDEVVFVVKCVDMLEFGVGEIITNVGTI